MLRSAIAGIPAALFLIFALSACQPQLDDQAALEDLAQAFRAANHADDIEPMLALYELEGATASTVGLLKNALHFELGLPIERIDFEPLTGAPEESIHYEHQGITYGPTLEPRYRMRVRYKTEDAFQSLFTIGQNAVGDWRIVSARPEPMPTGTPEHTGLSLEDEDLDL